MCVICPFSSNFLFVTSIHESSNLLSKYSFTFYYFLHWNHSTFFKTFSKMRKANLFYKIVFQNVCHYKTWPNVWCIKNRTKLCNVLLLCLVRFLMHQTLSVYLLNYTWINEYIRSFIYLVGKEYLKSQIFRLKLRFNLFHQIPF